MKEEQNREQKGYEQTDQCAYKLFLASFVRAKASVDELRARLNYNYLSD